MELALQDTLIYADNFYLRVSAYAEGKNPRVSASIIKIKKAPGQGNPGLSVQSVQNLLGECNCSRCCL